MSYLEFWFWIATAMTMVCVGLAQGDFALVIAEGCIIAFAIRMHFFPKATPVS